jgi:hypothetical protein
VSGAGDALIAALRHRVPGYDMHLHGPAPLPCVPLDPATILDREREIGHVLHALLVDIWCRIGNGGFGPGYGLLGLGTGGHKDDLGQTSEMAYHKFRLKPEKPPFLRWPDGLLPICPMGCAIYHCVDLKTQEMVIWEPNLWDGKRSFATALFPTGRALEDWLWAWADGATPSSWLTSDPATGMSNLAPLGIRIAPRKSPVRMGDDRQRGLFDRD